jgi:hypothetical protein
MAIIAMTTSSSMSVNPAVDFEKLQSAFFCDENPIIL